MHPWKTAGNLGGCKIGPTPVEFSRRDPRHPPRRRKASRCVCVGHRTGPKKLPPRKAVEWVNRVGRFYFSQGKCQNGNFVVKRQGHRAEAIPLFIAARALGKLSGYRSCKNPSSF